MSSAPLGVLDTNVFVHAQSNDRLSTECQKFLAALQNGTIQAQIEPIVLHELTFVLPRFMQQMTRNHVADYLLGVLRWPGVHGEKDVPADALQRWGSTPGLGFADAYLAASAVRRGCPVYTKNVRELVGQGAAVPDPLPGADQT